MIPTTLVHVHVHRDGHSSENELLRECLERSTKLLSDMQLAAAATSVHDFSHVLALLTRVQAAHQSIAASGHMQQHESVPPKAHLPESARLSPPSRPKRRLSNRASRSPSPVAAAKSDTDHPSAAKRSKRCDSGTAPNKLPSLASPTDLISPLTYPFNTHPIARRTHTLAVPTDILNAYFIANGTYAPRYLAPRGQLTIHGHVHRTKVIAHHLVPPRTVSSAAMAHYLALLKRTTNYTSTAPALIKFLLDRGFGAAATQQELETLAVGHRTPGRVVAQACTRPYILVCVASRAHRPDLWAALEACRDDLSVTVPEGAKLGLLVGIEMVGFEEPGAESTLPPEHLRTYALRERIAIVDTRYSKRRDDRSPAVDSSAAAGRDVGDDDDDDAMLPPPSWPDNQDDTDDLSSLDELDSDTDLAPRRPTPPAPPNPTLAGIPHSLLNQLSHSILSQMPMLRYCPMGRLRMHAHHPSVRVLAHILATPRVLPPEITAKYLAHASDVRVQSRGGPFRDTIAYAIRRGPTRKFSALEAHAAQTCMPKHGLYPIRVSLARWVARPVMLVDVLDRKAPEFRNVWERLVKQVVKTWDGSETEAERRRREKELDQGHLVMLLGLEVVGFEKPRVADVVPPLDEGEFVVRERFALVVGDLSFWEDEVLES